MIEIVIKCHVNAHSKCVIIVFEAFDYFASNDYNYDTFM